jgi:hypothetical protein
VVGKLKPFGLRNIVLALLDAGIVKLFDTTALEAHQMVVVLPLIELITSCAALELAARQDARLFELHQNAVNGCQSNIGAVI